MELIGKRNCDSTRKKYCVVALTMLVLLIAFTGGCGCFGKSPEQRAQEADKRTSEIGDEARRAFGDYSKEHDMEKAVDLTIDWLKKQEGVEKVLKGEGSITVQFKEGPDVLMPTDPRVWPKQ